MVKKIDASTDCWTWTGAKTSTGYGSFGYQGRTWSTHRLAYELLVGPIPDGLTIDHLCRNKPCCNPSHLEPVTIRENQRRAHEARYGAPQQLTNSGELRKIFDSFFGASA
jgi:hypothetical protein